MKTSNLLKPSRLPAGYQVLGLACPHLLIAILQLPSSAAGVCAPGRSSVLAGEGESGLVLKSDGTVWAWGWNDYGQLGDGTTAERLTPVQVSGLSGVVAFEVWVDFSYGGGEAGTCNAPYDRLAIGASAITANGTLHIEAGTSSETLTITKPMKIEACGGAAAVGW